MGDIKSELHHDKFEHDKPNFTIAVVEAKAEYKLPGDGLQQAMEQRHLP